jgi:SAM-dependent methyltransferase
MGGDFDYDARGAGYGKVRRPDPRIAKQIHAALGDARTVLNVGAGAGSYEPPDRHVVAIEPSAVMRAQRPADLSPAIKGFAEDLPLDDDAVDAAMGVWTVHQWSDLAKGLKELRRVARGPVVILAGDGDVLSRWWLSDYAPELIAAEQRRYPTMQTIAAGLGGVVEIEVIPIPLDCTDGIIEAFYGRPERLLDEDVRGAQSSWAFAGEGVEARFTSALSVDLRSGDWDARYGAWRKLPTYEGSLRLVVSRPA